MYDCIYYHFIISNN